MNKKKYIIILMVFILLCFISACSIKSVTNAMSDRFWGFVAEQMDKEEQKRAEKNANGEIVPGKDTVLIWKNMYEVWHNYDGDYLSIESKEIHDVVLKKVKKDKIKVKKKKLYIISEEGYAIIDENNLSRVYIAIPESEFVEEYSKDSQGNLLYRSRRIEDEHIQYLSDFSDYSIEEQKTLNSLK